jgi:hypothetical protein
MPPLPGLEEPLEGAEVEELDVPAPGAEDLDPMFAADVSEAFPDLDDTQLAALQRAIMGLLGR